RDLPHSFLSSRIRRSLPPAERGAAPGASSVTFTPMPTLSRILWATSRARRSTGSSEGEGAVALRADAQAGEGGLVDLQPQLDLVEGALAAHDELVVRRGVGEVLQRRLDLGGVDVHAAHDEHVVGAASDHPDARVRPAAGAGLAREARDVAGPEAQ